MPFPKLEYGIVVEVEEIGSGWLVTKSWPGHKPEHRHEREAYTRDPAELLAAVIAVAQVLLPSRRVPDGKKLVIQFQPDEGED